MYEDGTKSLADTHAVKRQKTASGYSTSKSDRHNGAYNSDIDSGDDLLANFVPDTPGKYQTQPTQILEQPTLRATSPPDTPGSSVQVAASSPFQERGTDNGGVLVNGRLESTSSPSSKISSLPQGERPGTKVASYGNTPTTTRVPFAMSMAPAGTAYRPPTGIVSKPPPTKRYIDLSNDDGPYYQGGSSDDEIEESANIKPTTFVSKSAQGSFGTGHMSGNSKSGGMPNRFEQFAYKGAAQNGNNSVIHDGQNRGSSSNPSSFNANTTLFGAPSISFPQPLKKGVQRRPDRAQPIKDIDMEDLQDEKLRDNVARIRIVFPDTTVLTAKNTLLKCHGSLDDAINFLAQETVVTISDDDDSPQVVQRPEPQMKRVLNGPAQSIRDKYSSTQSIGPHRQTASVGIAPPKKKKRLMQGRRNPSSPAVPTFSSPRNAIDAESPAAESYDSDSGVESAPDEEDPVLEDRVLKYLNICNIEDLVELTNTTRDLATVMLEARPFKRLNEARAVENAKTLKSGKKGNRVPIGEKIVDTAVDMFKGYEAIDTLVTKCGELSKPLTVEMTAWGFDVFGAAKDGELEMTSLEDGVAFQRDSGIGSPNSTSASNNGDDEVKIVCRTRASNVQFLQKPQMMAEDCILKDYQVVGLNWLALMSRHGLSGILADEMGLGKTCQVIAFLSHLIENGSKGPHLVVCPGSTLENWCREFRRFSPDIVFEPYHGPQKERVEMAEDILARRDKINVVITTYDMAAKKEDNKFMRKLRADVCVYDEGHMLKNVKSQRYQGLVRIPARFRLLLTGTPLQNNLQELAALLAFILPDVFKSLEEDLNTIFKAKATTSDSDHAALLSAQRIARARSMLTPFVLRRKKDQVLKHLPKKTCRVEYCTLQKAQREIYNGHLDQARERARVRVEGGKIPKNENNENNPLMQLRKAAIHPLLFRRHFTDAKIEKMADILRKKARDHFPESHKRSHLIDEMHLGSDFWLHQWCLDYPCISSFDIPDLQWMDSGKVDAMIRLVKSYKKSGDRVLIFSQFSLVLDILEAVLNSSLISFTRIDGSTKIDERQSLIDTYRDDEGITVFLLTTKAGGTGINLMYANKVIIFDSSFNPQDDRQAENRAHRVGQTREVEVVRLVTRGTVEEQIYALGQSKLELDGRVAGDEDAGKAEEAGEKAISKMLLDGTGIVADDEEVNDDDNDRTEAKTDEGNEKEEAVKAEEMVEMEKKLPQRKKSSILDMLTQKNTRSTKKRASRQRGGDKDKTTISEDE